MYNYSKKPISGVYFYFYFKKLPDGTSVTYDDIKWERKNNKNLLKLSFFTAIFSVNILKLSRNWYILSFIPYCLINYMDKKYVPYAQIESFYKYVYERRKADFNFKQNEKEILEKLNQNNSPELISSLQTNLKSANLTVYEAANDIYLSYLKLISNRNKEIKH